MRRIITGTLISALAVTGVLLLEASPSHAATTHVSGPAPMVVFGPNRQALIEAVSYWDRLAGHDVLTYGGIAGGDSTHTIEVAVGPLPGPLAGLTQGNVGTTTLAVTIAPAYADNWEAYAHEFGHTLGIGHHDDPDYQGVMHTTLIPESQVRPGDDKRFVF